MTDYSDLPDVPESQGGGGTATVSIDDVTEAMKDVVDPELGINVVDLGLVYGIHLDDDTNAVIDMTLTSAACPLTDVIQDQTNQALEGRVGLILDDVGERAGSRRQCHVQHHVGRLVQVDAVDQAQVDDIDPELGVDDVLHRLEDIVLGGSRGAVPRTCRPR